MSLMGTMGGGAPMSPDSDDENEVDPEMAAAAAAAAASEAAGAGGAAGSASSADARLTREELMGLPVRELKQLMLSRGLSMDDCIEKKDYVDRVLSSYP